MISSICVSQPAVAIDTHPQSERMENREYHLLRLHLKLFGLSLSLSVSRGETQFLINVGLIYRLQTICNLYNCIKEKKDEINHLQTYTQEREDFWRKWIFEVRLKITNKLLVFWDNTLFFLRCVLFTNTIVSVAFLLFLLRIIVILPRN